MEEKKIACSLITSLFSCGAYRDIPELRTSELKGAMRYVYRISSPSQNINILVKDEAELFGGAADTGKNAGHASPIRLSIHSNMKEELKDLLLHKTKKKPFSLNCFSDGDFKVTVRFNPGLFGKTNRFQQTVDLNWYVDLIKLSLILCGMGKRCRKGRGCFTIEGLSFKTQRDFLEWLCRTLNRIGAVSSRSDRDPFAMVRGEIKFQFDLGEYQRPVIQKIRMGNRLEKNQIDNYLRAVDKMSHELKSGNLKNDNRSLAKGITGLGDAGGKFASPLLIRVVQIEDSYYPLYIFLKSISGERWFDKNLSGREKFISYVENAYGGEGRQ